MFGFEAITGAKIIQYWIDIPLSFCSLILIILMTATNLFFVSSFGEFVLVRRRQGRRDRGVHRSGRAHARLVAGTRRSTSVQPGPTAGFLPAGSNDRHRRVFRHVDVLPCWSAQRSRRSPPPESSDQEAGAVLKAANSVITPVFAVFFVGSTFLLAESSSHGTTRRQAGVPCLRVHGDRDSVRRPHRRERRGADGGAELPELGVYTACRRMLFVLAARREAPAQLVQVTHRGVPAIAILASSVVGFLCVDRRGRRRTPSSRSC